MKIRYQKLGPHAQVPARKSDLANGFDLCAMEGGIINHNEIVIVRTGIALEFPERKDAYSNFYAFVVPRSGLAAKEGITVVNSPGLIDTDYRGELKIILTRVIPGAYQFKQGDRIAQLVIMEHPKELEFVRVSQVADTKRGSGGFGSTGR